MAGPEETVKAPTSIDSVLTTGLATLENERNKAAAAGDSAKVNQIAQQQAAMIMQAGVLGASLDVRKKMLELYPNLRKGLAEFTQKAGQDGVTAMMKLTESMRTMQLTSAQAEIDARFKQRMEAIDGPMKLISTFKGFGLLLASFGIDTSDFVRNCDDMIAAEAKKIPPKEIAKLGDIDLGIDVPQLLALANTTSAQAVIIANQMGGAVNQATAQAMAGTADPTGMQSSGAGRAPSTSRPAAPTAPGKPAAASAPAVAPANGAKTATALEAILREKGVITAAPGGSGVITGVDIKAAVDKAAKADGIPGVSARDQMVLDVQFAAIIAKAKGTAPDVAAAHQMTTEAIRRAREGAPAPQPS